MAKIAQTFREDFRQHFRTLGLAKGMDVYLSSRLIAFGKIPDGLEGLYAALRDVLGDAATVVVPTYTLHLGPNDIYDRLTTKSRAVGIFSEFMRLRSGAMRSYCPLHSHAAEGSRSHIFENCDPSRSFGRGTDFDALYQSGFHYLLLGCSFNGGAAYLHHVETLAEVPYREWIAFPRRILRNGVVETLEYHYFARNPEKIGDSEFTPV